MDDWGSLLPMASAILTVLWPDDFTVYDRRACGQIGGYQRLASRKRCDRVWDEYIEFKDAVRAAAPMDLSLRDADRNLFARSSAAQLSQQIRNGFKSSS